MLLAMSYHQANERVIAGTTPSATVVYKRRYLKMLMGVGLSLAFMVLTWR